MFAVSIIKSTKVFVGDVIIILLLIICYHFCGIFCYRTTTCCIANHPGRFFLYRNVSLADFMIFMNVWFHHLCSCIFPKCLHKIFPILGTLFTIGTLYLYRPDSNLGLRLGLIIPIGFGKFDLITNPENTGSRKRRPTLGLKKQGTCHFRLECT